MISWKKTGAAFEDFVAYVYQSLLNINDCPSIVSKRAKVKGLDGLEAEIDVYYEFEHLNMTYRVAIECKDWKMPIPVNEVRDFWAKIASLNNVAGVMISRNGYQSGAIKFANSKGIILMCEDDLPTINQILAGKIKTLFLPNEKAIGEPFWTLMEVKNGEVTGNYIELPRNEGLPLFISKKMAEKFLSTLPDKNDWCVRGLSQRQFKTMLDMADKFNWNIVFSPIPMQEGKIAFVQISKKLLREHYTS